MASIYILHITIVSVDLAFTTQHGLEPGGMDPGGMEPDGMILHNIEKTKLISVFLIWRGVPGKLYS